jgi:hypothetical protein
VIAFVSKDENLTTAHVTYLEARLLQMAKQGTSRGQQPEPEPRRQRLPESDVADMNNFIDNITTLLLALGVTIFEIVTITHARPHTLLPRPCSSCTRPVSVPKRPRLAGSSSS